MTTLLYILAVIGAVTVARWIVRAIRCIRQDLKSKPTPWLGLPWGPG